MEGVLKRGSLQLAKPIVHVFMSLYCVKKNTGGALQSFSHNCVEPVGQCHRKYSLDQLRGQLFPTPLKNTKT